MDFIEDSAENGQIKPGVIRLSWRIPSDYRVGIRKIFALEDDLRVVVQADSLENLRTALERYPSDVVLLEGALLGGSSSAVSELLRIAPEAKLIVQAVATDETQTVELYRKGVRGIISRSISPDLLVRCVRRIAAGKRGSITSRSTGSSRLIAPRPRRWSAPKASRASPPRRWPSSPASPRESETRKSPSSSAPPSR